MSIFRIGKLRGDRRSPASQVPDGIFGRDNGAGATFRSPNPGIRPCDRIATTAEIRGFPHAAPMCLEPPYQ
jgi:hypothetical protein